MNVTDYMRQQNVIIKDATGVTLVPEDQLKNMVVTNRMIRDTKQYVETLSRESYAGAIITWEGSPYCSEFFKDKSNYCEECPVYMAGNHCHLADSTYEEIMELIRTDHTIEETIRPKLIKLGKEFLESNYLRRGNQTLLSKELLGKAMKKSICRIIPDSSSDEKEAPGDDINFTVNEEYGVAYCCSKDEVAAKVKRWVCMSSMYFMSSCIKRDGCYAYIELETEPFKPQKTFEAKTEYEAIFKAGEWLMEEMEYRERQKEKEL